MKIYLSFILSITIGIALAQQRPFINSLDKTSAAVGETITITGSGFSSTPANNKVFFGAGEATVTSATTTQLKVSVPANATYDPVSVLNTTTKLIGYSSELFLLSYGGNPGTFGSSGFDTFKEIATGNQLAYDLCMCDFNSDDLLDIGISHEDDTTVNIFQNQSTTASTTFSEIGTIQVPLESGLAPDANLNGIDCGDLNNDGLPDLIVSKSNGNLPVNIYYYRNTSGANISFTLAGSTKMPNQSGGNIRTPRLLRIADIDGDGRNDFIIGSQTDNTLFVYLHDASNNVAFNSPVAINVSGIADLGLIDIKDLNNDNLPDIAATAFDEANQPIAFLENNSTPGNVKFTSKIISSPSQRNFIYIADLNSDDYPEIIASSLSNSSISIFQNTTSSKGGAVSFSSSPINVTGITSVWGINSGDINGDGLTDLVVSNGNAGVKVLINQFDGSTLSFTQTSLSTPAQVSRNIQIGDLNGDARPDITFTYNSTNGAAGKLGLFTNRNCYLPTFEPADLTYCPNVPFTLYTTKTADATYNWAITSGTGTVTPNGSGDNADVTITSASATIEVTITPGNNGSGSCTNTSSQVFNVTGTPAPTPTITPSDASSPICSGADLTLSSSTTADNYYWILPDGSTGADAKDLVLTGLTSAEAGIYTLRTQNIGGCVSSPATYEVVVNEPPFITITNQGQDNFCQGSSITLEVPDFAGFTYSWERDGSPIAGTLNTLSVNTTGTYVAIITDATTCENRSPGYTVTAVPAPVSSFTTSYSAANTSEICIDVPLDFAATSTGSGAFALSYAWDFDDTNTATGATTSHAYSVAASYSATLTTSYTDITGCSDQTMTTITVSDQVPGDIPITVVGGSTDKCPSDTLLVQLPANYISYLWSTGDTDFEAEAFTASGETQVTLTADVETNIGCMVTVSQTIDNFPNSGIPVTASEGTITNDSITLAEGEQIVTLTASNAVGDYAWAINGDPSSVISSALEVQPTTRTTVVTVTGTDANGCVETTTTTILLPSILPRKTFSPNADGLGFDCWEILNTSSLTGCTVYIFDNRGRQLLEKDSPFENNCVWDGTAMGQPAPEGIYFFVLKCDDELNNTNGTITLAR
ncbi:MAG: FG-GAP-like repeat-containing protein [Bacteroidota bacterium]